MPSYFTSSKRLLLWLLLLWLGLSSAALPQYHAQDTPTQPAQRVVNFSGPVLTYDTKHFRIHYTLVGVDAATFAYVQQVAQAMEEVYAFQVGQMGWPAPPPDAQRGGDDRYDVYLLDLIDEFQRGDLGRTQPELPPGNNPNTSTTEQFAVASYILLDNDYREISTSDPLSVMRATAAHEFHHAIQFGYDFNEPLTWYYEATSTWMETITFPKEQDATGYVGLVFTYPEICLGAEGDADPTGGLLMYGGWLFMQSIADAHGHEVVLRLWENIATHESWAALEATLAPHADTLPQAAERYHLQNLMRDYKFAPEFADSPLWLEGTITNTGDWQAPGGGVQELAANYFAFALPGGTYALRLDEAALRLWLVGLAAPDRAEALLIKEGMSVDTTPYRQAYLMVFNPAYDDDMQRCTFTHYRLSVAQAAPNAGPSAGVVYTLNPRHYAPPGG